MAHDEAEIARTCDDGQMAVLSLYVGSAQAFARAVAEIPASLWTAPGLGEWDVRSLVGHTARAIDTVREYLQQPAPAEATLPTAEGYYAALWARSGAGAATVPDRPSDASGTSSAAITARGVAAGVTLGDDPAATVRAKVDAIGPLLADQPQGRIIAARGAAMPLTEYLRTRLFELVVHSLDIERATGVHTALPTGAVLEAARLAVGIAEATGSGDEVLLALTGRGELPPGFSVV